MIKKALYFLVKKSTKIIFMSKLLKIGELAREINRLPSTIHFYTQEKLLKPSSYTKGGYRLYEKNNTIQRIRQIEKLQDKKRWTIAEIKNYFLSKN